MPMNGGMWTQAGVAAVGGAFLLFVLLNLLAFWRAHVMTHLDLPAVVPEGQPACPAGVGLAYQTHRVAGPEGTLDLWYVPHPEPAGVVVLCHGFQCWKASLLAEARALHQLGYACVLFDFRNWGRSEGRACTIGYREAEDVLCVLRHARARWAGDRPLILFGHSMGAAAALRALSLSEPGPVAAAVLECPYDRVLHAIAARLRSLCIPPFPLARLILFWGGVQQRFNSFGLNPKEYAREVRCPVLLLSGNRDRQVPPWQTRAIAANLPPSHRVHFFAGLEHQSYVRARPEEWKDRVGEFLAAHGLAPARRHAA